MIPTLFCLIAPLCSDPTEAQLQKRIQSHLLISDPLSAVEEAKRAKGLFPDSYEIHKAYIRALCARGDEVDALEEWSKQIDQVKEGAENRRILETLAWSVLHKADTSSQLNMRLYALLGAAFTRDVKAIPLIQEAMRGSNSLMRSMGVRLATSFGDAPLRDEMIRLLKEEKVWYVRLEVIQAVGQLRIRSAEEILKQIVASPKTLAEERGAALCALVSMYESISREKLSLFAKSNRAGLRQLSCEIIQHLDQKEDLDLLLPLLKDPSPEVKISALNTMALLNAPKMNEGVELLLNDGSPAVAITAAYCLLIHGDLKGEVALREWMEKGDLEWSRLASAAVRASGPFGIKLAYKEIGRSTDPYVKANLALGLIGQRENVKGGCEALFNLLSQEEDLWMWDDHHNPLFRSLSPSKVRHIEEIPHYPTVVDQLVRLDLLSVLSIMRYPQAQKAVKNFLQTKSWGVAGAAATTLVEEGDEEALFVVRGLLTDPEENIRMQSAFILAFVGNDPEAIDVLQKAYPHVDREMKVHVLEALGSVGDPRSIPFLLEVLKEPFQMLRVVAASALIQCLYH